MLNAATGFLTLHREEVYVGLKGKPIRVEVNRSPNSGRVFLNARGWVYADAYPNFTKSLRRPMTYAKFIDLHPQGVPNRWVGLPSLEPSAADRLAETLARAALVAEELADD